MAMMETFFGTWNIGVFVIFVLVNNINFLIWKFQILHKNMKCTHVNIINLKFEPKIWKNTAYSLWLKIYTSILNTLYKGSMAHTAQIY